MHSGIMPANFCQSAEKRGQSSRSDKTVMKAMNIAVDFFLTSVTAAVTLLQVHWQVQMNSLLSHAIQNSVLFFVKGGNMEKVQ